MSPESTILSSNSNSDDKSLNSTSSFTVTCNRGLLPVTLLSGFLGSGKTTLLQHILKNKQDYKCAVIVNDMASINIDASLIQNATVLQKEEKLVQFQNGCICCTLRGDLLQEIATLAESGQFDYLVIESTGISEPMQVAETFGMTAEDLANAPEITEGNPLKSLVGLARLDTCVTVVDVSNIMETFEDGKFISQRFENVDPDDERTVVDLLCDQIEFADVILLNKVDLVSQKTLHDCKQLIKKLNPRAELVETKYSKVSLDKVLDTKKFNYELAAMSPGWLQSLKEPELVPETEEYGISSFLFKARRPFHPKRLFDFVEKYFVIIESPSMSEPPLQIQGQEYPDEDPTDDMEVDGDQEDEDGDEEQEDDDENQGPDEADIQQRQTAKKASPLKNLFRSKGFIWIATRPKNMGEWSQAGLMLTISNGGNWFSELDDAYWPQEPEIRERIKLDYHQELGDKRQEMVLIGQFTSKDREWILSKLKKCLLTDKEWKLYENGDLESFEDPWESWEYMDFGGEDEQESPEKSMNK